MEMEAELLQLAQDAVAALEAGPRWVEIAQLIFSGVGLAWIGWGFFRMGQAGKRRDREIDVMAQGLEKQVKQAENSTQLLGKTLDRQGEVMTEAVQGLRQQGEVLAELLRRTA